MRIMVTGAAGRLGAATAAALLEGGHAVFALNRSELDVCSASSVALACDRLRPDAIINCTAYNAVDGAETDRATAFAVNADAPSILASASDACGAVLVHYSTDFVFDGTSTRPYEEDAPTNPLSVYGASKLAGEIGARQAGRHYILRLESVFGGLGVNGHRATVDYIADTLASGGVVRAIVDRTVTPSYVPDVIRATAALLQNRAAYGTYHCVASGTTTWYELAEDVARRLGFEPRIEPVQASDLKTVAPRPRFCALSNERLARIGIEMPTWQFTIERHLASRSIGGYRTVPQ